MVNAVEGEARKLIVVLGAGLYSDGTLYESSKANVEKGIEIFKKDEKQAMIFSGKWNYFLKPEPPITEARAMKIYAMKLGLPEANSIEEDNSYDTIGNAYYTDKIISKMGNVGSITVVSSTWHTRKSSFIFEKVFANRFEISFEKAEVYLPKEKQEQMAVQEHSKLQKLIRIYGSLQNGDNKGFAKLVEAQHPFYATDKSKIPEEEWRIINSTVPTINYII